MMDERTASTADAWARAGRPNIPLEAANVEGSEPVPSAPAGTSIDALLTPTRDVEQEATVHYGTLRVDRDLVDDFGTAQRYLSKDPEALDTLYFLQNATKPYAVARVGDGNDSFDPETQTINWDPKSALLDADGSKQSAAMGLLHEEGHAAEWERDPERSQRNAATPTRRFDNAEEQRNIHGVEHRAVKFLPGEGTREDHGGVSYVATGPTTTERAPGPSLADGDQQAWLTAIDNERASLAAHGYPVLPEAADVKAWDHTKESGPILHLDGNTVAQSTGRGSYVVYDVERDLHGVMPPENRPGISIDAQGQVQAQASKQQAIGASR